MSRNTTNEEEYKRLRAYLDSSIRGKNTDSILTALATGVSAPLINSVEFVHDQIYIATAVDRYLEQRLADYGLSKPEAVGLDDDIFREIGISVINRKQVRDLIMSLLTTIFGDDATKSIAKSSTFEPYQLQDQDTLILRFDGQDPIIVTFFSSQFSNINAATATEVSDVITKELRKQGRSGSAFAKDDGLGSYVNVISNTEGPSSSVTVLGGKSQNKLKFDEIVPNSPDASTQWTVTQVAGGKIRFTYSGGANPNLQKVSVSSYVNIYGSAFNSLNRGTFTVLSVTDTYFEFLNPFGVSETTVQGTIEAVLFFNPIKNNIWNKMRYAAVYQTNKSILQVFLPATSRVVRRSRKGAGYINDNYVSGNPDTYGPYLYDTTQNFTLSEKQALTSSEINPTSGRIIQVVDSTQFPDESGFFILGYGTSHQEGPIPYLARPSATTLLVSPAYNLKNTHLSGTDVAHVDYSGPVQIAKDGSDYPAYITDTSSGRVYAEELINLVVATGIKLIVTIIYPNDIGLGKWNTVYSDKIRIWGE